MNIAEKFYLEGKMNFLKRKPYESCACGSKTFFPPFIRPTLFFCPEVRRRTLLQPPSIGVLSAEVQKRGLWSGPCFRVKIDKLESAGKCGLVLDFVSQVLLDHRDVLFVLLSLTCHLWLLLWSSGGAE